MLLRTSEMVSNLAFAKAYVETSTYKNRINLYVHTICEVL